MMMMMMMSAWLLIAFAADVILIAVAGHRIHDVSFLLSLVKEFRCHSKLSVSNL
jgi:hypothetical protein